MTSLLLALFGLVILVVGAELLVRGAAALAHRLGVPAVAVGMTVVAFGTSTPELVVNLTAAFGGSGDIGFGNVVGSNIANIALLLGITALVRPLTAHPSIVTREIPMMILAGAVAVALGCDAWFNQRPDVFDRGDGAVLLLLFGVFMYYTINDARRRPDDPFEVETAEQATPPMPIARSVVFIIFGLVGLVFGGRLLIDGAVHFAQTVGVSEAVIGLTLVAVGTSLPELATSIVAVRRRHDDIAVGNIVGSNIFNLLFIAGLSSTITPISVPVGGRIDLLVMAGVSLLLLPMAITHRRRITRTEGALLLAIYAGYLAVLINR